MKVIMFPGQGSQYKGMGKSLFLNYRKETQLASEILGYDIQELCIDDPNKNLGLTQFTQPALFVVNTFDYWEQFSNLKPDFLIGHSLGEYNALLAAGVFDFETGLRLVKKRGELMAAAAEGSMAAVLDLGIKDLQIFLQEDPFKGIDIANYNTPKQTVVAGTKTDILAFVKRLEDKEIRAVVLNVSAPFHSRYMLPAVEEFNLFSKQFAFNSPEIPVISNVLAKPYGSNQQQELLTQQIASSVLWTDSISFLLQQGVSEFVEIGGTFLTKMVNEIKKEFVPIPILQPIVEVKNDIVNPQQNFYDFNNEIKLGSSHFRKTFRTKYAYVVGSMHQGISSANLVVRCAQKNIVSFFGTQGLSIVEVEKNIISIKDRLKNNEIFGLNLTYSKDAIQHEFELTKLYIKHQITLIEISAYTQVTAALVYYRVRGMYQTEAGKFDSRNKIIAKLSRPDIAEQFLSPAPEHILKKLVYDGLLSEEEALNAKRIPICTDICVETDTGGLTEGRSAMTVLPAIHQLKNAIQSKQNIPITVGLAGGIGTPEAAACAFLMGADFILTGSINQCTVEADISDEAKELLQTMNVQDTAIIPSFDDFDLGLKTQVLRKGVLFQTRANLLHKTYTNYESIDVLPLAIKQQIEEQILKCSIDTIWKELAVESTDSTQIKKAMEDPKHKMSLIFKHYDKCSKNWAKEGNLTEQTNFQIHTSPSLGAFNQWVKNTKLENWKNRHIDEIGEKIMKEADQYLKKYLQMFNN